MRYTRRTSVLIAILGLALVPVVLGSCGGSCSKRLPDATFAGRLTAVRTATAIFTVESVQATPGQTAAAHIPTLDATVAVHYVDGQERFLRVGERYRVAVGWNGRGFESGIHVADDPCSGGTVHADGSGIDTARVSWLRIHRALIALALAPLVALLLLSGWIWIRRRRASDRVGDRRE